MRILPTAALISLVALPAFPQLPKLVETVEVRIVNVDVVVRDRSGKPVRGLTKDDFELYQDRVRQTITNLYEVDRDMSAAETETAAAAPAEMRRRKMLLFLDNTSLEPSRKNNVLAAAERFINERMRPDDQTMLVSWRLGLHVVTPFTSDKEAIRRGIAAISRMSPAGELAQPSIQGLKHDIQDYVSNALSGFMSWNEAYALAISRVDRYSSSLLMQQEPLLEALNRMVESMGGLEGKKVLVYVGAYLPDRPGAELYRYAYDQFAPHMNRVNPLDLQSLAGVMGNHVHASIDEMAHQAAGYGITMYAIDAARNNSEFSAETSGTYESTESESRDANTVAALQMMANITGGIAVAHTSNFDFAFDTVGHDLDSYYSLGYKPTEEGTHRITVKMKNRAWRVRSRETFTMKSTDDQMNDRAIANVYIENLASAWPISLRTGTPKRDGRTFMIPVEVVMPSTITLLPQEDKLVGGFTLYFVVGGGDGQTSSVLRRPQELRIPVSAERLVRAKPMTFTTAIRVKPGESTLSVAIIDQISGTTGYARAKVAAR
jgi:VWFA-related protein